MGRTTGPRAPGFISSVLALVNEFYGGVVQEVAPWRPPAPKLTRTATPAPTEDARENVRDDPQVFPWPRQEGAGGDDDQSESDTR